MTRKADADTTAIRGTERDVTLTGTAPIMFDRYAGDNDTKLDWWQKLYLRQEDAKTLVLPSLNVMSFLSAHNTNSAPKRLRDKRKFKDICNACLSFVTISPHEIPFLRDGKEITLGVIEGGIRDPLSGIYRHTAVARLDKGIPNPKVRPVLPLPWSLKFHLSISAQNEITEQELINLFTDGGRALGLGTFRGVFGKFRVETWE